MSEMEPAVKAAPATARIVRRAALLAVAFFATAHLGEALAIPGTPVAPFWIPSGLQLAAVALHPPSTWPIFAAAIAIADLAFNLTTAHPLRLSLGFVASNLVEALLGAWLLRRLVGPRPELRRVLQLLAFFLVAGVATAVSATTAALAVRVSLGGPYLDTWRIWWSSSLLGNLVAAPVLLSGRVPRRRDRWGAVAEACGIAAVLAAACAELLLRPRDSAISHEFLLFPGLVWAALSLGVRGAAAFALAVALALNYGASRGLGELVPGPDPAALSMHLQLFLGAVVATCTILAALATERRQALVAVREAKEIFDLFLEHSPALVYVKDAESSVAVALSRSIERFTGRPVSEMIGRPEREFLPAEFAERVDRDDARVVATGGAVELIDSVGTRTYRTVKFPIRREGQSTLIGSISSDVTEHQQAELAMRMASVGTLAAGVAHEINNPLAFVASNLEYVEGRLATLDGQVDLGDTLAALGDAREGARRVRDIVRDLRSFSRPVGPETRERVDVREPLRVAVSLAQNEIRHRARLVEELGDVPPVLAPEPRLTQVFLNLLVNAAHAIPEARAAAHRIGIRTYPAAGGRVVIEVSDTGCGMTPEVRARAFEPFFTTKPVGTGTGLGLAICHGIVTALGGTIEVESEPGLGSTFRVLLPAAEPAGAEAAPAAAAEAPSPARRARVLVVDDEPLVGRAVIRILQPTFDVEWIPDADAALSRIAKGDRWDAVLCDLMMPQMSGMEFHERLAKLDGRLVERTVFMTGGAFTGAAQTFLEHTAAPHVLKPFDARALREAVVARLRQVEAEPV